MRTARFNFTRQRLGLAAAAFVVLSLSAVHFAQAQEKNIALGRPYVMDTAPGYPLLMDSGNATQLTDGKYANPQDTLWVQRGISVGWRHVTPVVVTVDLGEVQSISGASWSTAAYAPAGVEWPYAIFVLVSDDQRTWRRVGDLVRLSEQAGHVPPPASKGGNFRFKTDQIKARGRYVRLVAAPHASYLFCDEIEIYRGPDSLLTTKMEGPIVTDLDQLARNASTNAGIQHRLHADLADVRALLAASRLSPAQKADLGGRLDSLEKEIPNIPDADAATFRTIYPMNDMQAKILEVNGALMRQSGLPVLSAGKTDRYDYFSPLKPPARNDGSAAVSVDMMGNEVRADSFLLTNASEKPIVAQIRLMGLPGGATPPWLTLSAIPWTDTYSGLPIASALPVAQARDGTYPVTLPAGLTTKIWLSVDSAKLEQGEYTGTIQVESDSQPLSLPFDLRVSSVRMGKPRLSLGMWDGSQDGRYGPNTAQAIRLMNSHLVDSPWSNLDVLPWPDDSYFDASDKLTRPLSFKALDAWVAQRPGARHYFVFANVGDEFTGIKAGTPRFNARVASWAAAVAEHMRSLKLNPEQLGLLLIDEPANAEQTQRMVHWAAAIRAASPRVAIFQDMDIVHGSETSEYSKLLLQAATLSDIFCPQLIVYNAGGDAAATYFRNLQQEDRQLWFYQCMGPPKSYGPQIYYRLAAWHAFVRDARGLGFWAFSDEGNARSSWNEYETSRMPYSPVFLDPKGITNSIHWDAVREGIEDHEYLSMLQDAIGQATDAKLKSDAQSLLNASGNALLKTYPVESADYAWIKSDANPFQPDGYRVRVLRLLEKLQTN